MGRRQSTALWAGAFRAQEHLFAPSGARRARRPVPSRGNRLPRRDPGSRRRRAHDRRAARRHRRRHARRHAIPGARGTRRLRRGSDRRRVQRSDLLARCAAGNRAHRRPEGTDRRHGGSGRQHCLLDAQAARAARHTRKRRADEDHRRYAGAAELPTRGRLRRSAAGTAAGRVGAGRGLSPAGDLQRSRARVSLHGHCRATLVGFGQFGARGPLCARACRVVRHDS